MLQLFLLKKNIEIVYYKYFSLMVLSVQNYVINRFLMLNLIKPRKTIKTISSSQITA